MPTIEENKRFWSNPENFPGAGEYWSRWWGGSDLQWWGVIFPRIHLFLPTDSILEIAPGFGRWTTYLRNLCKQLTIVDLAEECIETCKKRFSDCNNIKYYVNDGKSLVMIPDRTVDFAFSFDSLVHADEEPIRSYINQLSTKLKTDGIAFIHHSNIGKCMHSLSRILWDQPYANWRFFPEDHGRARTMTRQKFLEFSEEAGMCCISQECINWGSTKLIDCISIITPKGSIWERPNRVLQNGSFMKEARNSKKIAELYGAKSFPKLRLDRKEAA